MADLKIKDLPSNIAHRYLSKGRFLSGFGVNIFRSSPDLNIEIGPFKVAVSIDYPAVREEFLKLYAPYSCSIGEEIMDSRLHVHASSFLRRFVRKNVTVSHGYKNNFYPLRAEVGAVATEMGFNWSVAMGCRHLLLLHAGVIEKKGMVVIMPGASGSGKSTLSAGLGFHGWRLFSDEFGLVDLSTHQLLPYPRPVSLKNKSIEVMRELLGSRGVFSQNYYDTPKGTMAYLQPPEDSILRHKEPAKARKIIFPQYIPDEPATKIALTKTLGFLKLIHSSVNFGIIGEKAFKATEAIIDECDIFAITYPSMEEGMRLVNEIMDNDEKSDDLLKTAGERDE